MQVKVITLARINAIRLLLSWDDEGILDEPTLYAMSNKELANELNARQTPEVGEIYNVK